MSHLMQFIALIACFIYLVDAQGHILNSLQRSILSVNKQGQLTDVQCKPVPIQTKCSAAGPDFCPSGWSSEANVGKCGMATMSHFVKTGNIAGSCCFKTISLDELADQKEYLETPRKSEQESYQSARTNPDTSYMAYDENMLANLLSGMGSNASVVYVDPNDPMMRSALHGGGNNAMEGFGANQGLYRPKYTQVEVNTKAPAAAATPKMLTGPFSSLANFVNNLAAKAESISGPSQGGGLLGNFFNAREQVVRNTMEQEMLPAATPRPRRLSLEEAAALAPDFTNIGPIHEKKKTTKAPSNPSQSLQKQLQQQFLGQRRPPMHMMQQPVYQPQPGMFQPQQAPQPQPQQGMFQPQQAPQPQPQQAPQPQPQQAPQPQPQQQPTNQPQPDLPLNEQLLMQKFIEIAKANPNLNNDELFTKLMQDEYAQHNPSQQYAPYSGILQAQPGSPQQPEPATVLNPFAPAKKPLNPPTQLVNPYEVKSAKEIPPFQSQQPTPVLEQDLLNTEKAVQVLQLLKASQQGGFDLSKLSEKDINFLANMGANIPGQTFDEPGAKIPAYASYPNPPQLSPLDSPNDSNQQQYSPVAPLSVPDYASGPKYTYTNTQSTPAAQCGVPKNIRPGDLSFIFNNGRGNGRQGRIAGGQLAVTGEVCWQAAIMYDGQYFSGGTILSDKHIITAAHEVHGKDWSRISVKLGLTDLRSRIDPRCDLKSEYFIANVIVSPNFNPRTLSSDIVVLELAEKINLNSHCVCTACLKPQMPKEGDRCVVSGYGSSRLVDPSGTPNERSAAGLAGENTEVLSYVALPIVSNTVCSSGLRNERIAPVIPPPFGILDSTQLCAGGVGSRDACYGDGGSPLVCFHADSFYLAGVVSYGRGCGKQLLPGVYASVPAQLQWLENVIAS